MNILAIDTSSKICSVAILEDTNLIIEKNSDDEKTHSQKLMPLIKEIFDEKTYTLDNIDLITCCVGPGSFTGIRIGVSTVKAFSDSKNIPVTGVTSLESLAYNISTSGYIVSLIDAKNDNVYFSLYKLENNIYSQIEDYTADNISSVIKIIEKYSSSPITFVGDGAVTHKNLLDTAFCSANFATDIQNNQTGFSLGKAGFNKFKLGLYGTSDTLSPIYLKKSQAERALEGQP